MLFRFMLLALTALTVTGCFRQADEPFATLPPSQSTSLPLTQPTADGGGTPLLVTLPPANDTVIPTQPMIITVEATGNPLLFTDTTPTELPTATLAAGTDTMGGGGMLTDLIIVTNTPTSGPSPTSDLPATPTDAFFDPTGQPQLVNPACEYTVQSGETLLGIANRNNVSVSALRSANNISGDLIRVGDKLIIPDCDAAPITTTPEPTGTAVPSGFTSYTVQSGDTLFSIAQRNGTTVQAIVDANELSNPNALNIGDVLLIPQN